MQPIWKAPVSKPSGAMGKLLHRTLYRLNSVTLGLLSLSLFVLGLQYVFQEKKKNRDVCICINTGCCLKEYNLKPKSCSTIVAI